MTETNGSTEKIMLLVSGQGFQRRVYAAAFDYDLLMAIRETLPNSRVIDIQEVPFYSSRAEWESVYSRQLKERALAKLTHEEQVALGLSKPEPEDEPEEEPIDPLPPIKPLSEIFDFACLRAKIKSARKIVSELCHGKHDWTMCIPAQPKSDSDLVLLAPMEALERLLDYLDFIEAEDEEDGVSEIGIGNLALNSYRPLDFGLSERDEDACQDEDAGDCNDCCARPLPSMLVGKAEAMSDTEGGE